MTKTLKIKLILLYSIVPFIAFAQSDCSKFKIGKYQNIESGIVKAEIERDTYFQYEKYGEKEIKLAITWIDDCSYQLEFIEGNEAFWNSRPKDMPTPDLIVRITSWKMNTYTQESKFVGETEFNYKSQITKVE